MIRVSIIAALLLINHAVAGQTSDERLIKGKVIDSKTKLDIPYAQIASYKLVSVFAADSLGRFNIMTTNSDSLKIFSIGYDPVKFYVTDSVDDLQVYVIELNKQSILLGPVDVHPWTKESIDKSLNLPYGIHLGQGSDVPVSLRSEVGDKPTVLSALGNPISSAYYFLSKREKKKRKLRRILATESFQGLLSNQLLGEISGLKGEELNNFRVYCNVHIKLGPRDNDQTIRFKVLDALHEFLKQKKQPSIPVQ